MRRFVIVVAALFVAPILAQAQTKPMAGTALCTPPSEEHVIAVPGRPHHSYAVSQAACTWPKPWKVEGVASVEGVGVEIREDHGNWSRSEGTFVDTLANGDKGYYSYSYETTMKDGKPQIGKHAWKLLGGTGMMKGVKGKGTCNVTMLEDGKASYQCSGEYTPAP